MKSGGLVAKSANKIVENDFGYKGDKNVLISLTGSKLRRKRMSNTSWKGSEPALQVWVMGKDWQCL